MNEKLPMSEETFQRAARRLAFITGEHVSHYDLARAFGMEFDPETAPPDLPSWGEEQF